MANSTTNLDPVLTSQANKEAVVNAALDAMSQAATYGRRASTSSGLTWGYYGGNVVLAGGSTSQIANGTLTLTPSSTNYIVAAKADGAVSVSTSDTNWNNTADYWRLYSVVTGTATVTSWVDHRCPGQYQGGGGMTNPMTDENDLIVGGAAGLPTRLPIGTEGQVLKVVSGDVAWAAESGGGGGAAYAPVETNGGTSITLALADAGDYIKTTASSAVTITVPPQSSVAWEADTEIHVEQGGTGTVEFVAGSGVTINHLAAVDPIIAGRYGVATLKRTAEDVWTLFGALAEASS